MKPTQQHDAQPGQNPNGQTFRKHAARIVAIAVIAALYGVTQLPVLPTSEREALAERFRFTEFGLTELSNVALQSRRTVNPNLEQHSGWISAVGAAVALADLDGDGLANDVCHIDPRNDLVSVAPVPGTGDRYPIVALDPAPLRYDSKTMAPMGCIPGDFNEDGRMDIFVYYWGRSPITYLKLAGHSETPTLGAYHAVELSTAGERWYTNGATFADLDGDGHLDLVIGNYFQDGARILDARATEPDSMQHSMSRAFNGGVNRIYRWVAASADARVPSVGYEEVPGLFEERVEHAWTLAIGAADLDGDLLPELYFANDFGPDRLLHNRSEPGRLAFAVLEGRRELVTPRSKVLGRDSFKGMGVDFADINGDGWLDFFVSNIAADYALHESHFMFVSNGDTAAMSTGRAPYVERSETLGVSRSSWGLGTRFGDFDNDGVYEALQATGFVKGDIDRWPELQELATGNDELLARASSWPRLKDGDDLSGRAAIGTSPPSSASTHRRSAAVSQPRTWMATAISTLLSRINGSRRSSIATTYATAHSPTTPTPFSDSICCSRSINKPREIFSPGTLRAA